jgi:hypothetical protein
VARRRRVYLVSRPGNQRCETLVLSREERRVLGERGYQVEEWETGRWPTARERAASSLWRAGFARWQMGRAYPPNGVEGLSGVPWAKADGQRHHEGHAAPLGSEARELGRRYQRAAWSYWMERAAFWRLVAETEAG